ncbi:hypothetical protein THRCLA_07599 [Thraustotheca clavata]|uniref:Uncharacterized protein n=1 Tax=Thraustotheca clavata TaxID=74557 RepID=A0A1V9ZD31_9STRA|nr:hypothetical protein THRCLA_07599 [Thraustotheca clavata]
MCLPCILGENYMKAYEIISGDKSKKIYQVAIDNEIDRTKLLALVRWHRVHDASANNCKSALAHATTPAKGEKKKLLYTKEILQYAVKYANDNSCGCRAAARATEIKFKLSLNSLPHSTVNEHIKSHQLLFSRAGAHRKLSPFEEELAAQMLIQQQATAPMTKREAADALIALLCRRDRPNPFENCIGKVPSEGFWRGFLQRHPEIQLQKTKHKQ